MSSFYVDKHFLRANPVLCVRVQTFPRDIVNERVRHGGWMKTHGVWTYMDTTDRLQSASICPGRDCSMSISTVALLLMAATSCFCGMLGYIRAHRSAPSIIWTWTSWPVDIGDTGTLNSPPRWRLFSQPAAGSVCSRWRWSCWCRRYKVKPTWRCFGKRPTTNKKIVS